MGGVSLGSSCLAATSWFATCPGRILVDRCQARDDTLPVKSSRVFVPASILASVWEPNQFDDLHVHQENNSAGVRSNLLIRDFFF